MIVRILGEGQLDVPDSELDQLNVLDGEVEAAVERGDHDAFRAALTQLLDAVRASGQPVPDDDLRDSDLILPPGDASLEEVRGLLEDDGLIPG